MYEAGHLKLKKPQKRQLISNFIIPAAFLKCAGIGSFVPRQQANLGSWYRTPILSQDWSNISKPRKDTGRVLDNFSGNFGIIKYPYNKNSKFNNKSGY